MKWHVVAFHNNCIRKVKKSHSTFYSKVLEGIQCLVGSKDPTFRKYSRRAIITSYVLLKLKGDDMILKNNFASVHFKGRLSHKIHILLDYKIHI